LSLFLETARLRLRPLRPSDLSFVAGLGTDAKVTRYLGGPRNPEELACSIRESALDPGAKKFDLWPMEEKPSGRLVGHCGLLEKEVEGQGEIELVYLIALIHPENLASEKVALRIGMRLEREIIRPGGNRRKLYALRG
jgi:RimJ/RimL family protein N-acetyltransferase